MTNVLLKLSNFAGCTVNFIVEYKHFFKALHCVKRVCIRSFSGPYFPAIGLNMERKTPNTDTFHVVLRSNVERHGRKPSSMYLLNNSSINLQLSWQKYFGSSTRNKTVSSSFVPIAVPIAWLNISSNKIVIFQRKFSCF